MRFRLIGLDWLRLTYLPSERNKFRRYHFYWFTFAGFCDYSLTWSAQPIVKLQRAFFFAHCHFIVIEDYQMKCCNGCIDNIGNIWQFSVAFPLVCFSVNWFWRESPTECDMCTLMVFTPQFDFSSWRWWIRLFFLNHLKPQILNIL